jgi:hypothetical protein
MLKVRSIKDEMIFFIISPISLLSLLIAFRL